MNWLENQPTITYPWYGVGTWEVLQQGDILPECPVILPTDDFAEKLSSIVANIPTESPIQVDIANLIVMSQSCDLENDKIDQVLLCATFPAAGYTKNERSDIIKERRPAAHMIEKCDIEGADFGRQVVDFRTVYTLPKDFAIKFVTRFEKRVRLLPPYREHLSQAFARYFMRVGLPSALNPE